MHQLHRQKLLSLFASASNEIIFLRGASVSHRYGTDFEYPFRQESNFLYLTGLQEPDFALMLDPASGEFHLFIPRRDAMYAVWMGFVKPMSWYQENLRPDRIHYTDEIPRVLKLRKPAKVHCVFEADADEVTSWGLTPDLGELADALAFCRVIKSDYEKEELRKAAKIANLSHREVAAALRPGMMEYELMALHQYICTKNGLRHQPYGGIHAGGVGSAVLHYVDNNRKLKDGDLYLIDAGAESNGYAADITRTYPVNGTFTPDQKFVYDVVNEMLNTSLANAGPGVEMEHLQLEACRLLVTRFREAGFLKGDTEELMDNNIFALFFPHGLGHFLGLDTHDPGGYPKGVERIDRPGLRYLRARRMLEPGMVVTIEPGIYFIPALLEPAFDNPDQAKYLNVNELRRFLNFGGIRLEDNIIVTEDGHENLTDVPR